MVHPFHKSLEDFFDDLLNDYELVEILDMAGCSDTEALVSLYKAGQLELPDALDPTSSRSKGPREG